MLEAKVDQFNLVMRPYDFDLLDSAEWSVLAEKMIQSFIENTKIDQLFGQLSESDSFRPAGYNVVYNFNGLPAHAIAFSVKQADKGLLISTNAHFWNMWQQRYFEKFNERLELFKLFKMIQNPKVYTAHFSRVDLAIDFIDEGIDVGALYRSIMNGRSEIYYDKQTKKAG